MMPREAIERAVAEREQAMVRFLETVVDMDSPTENKALADAVGDVFQARAEALGLAAARERHDDVADTRLCRHRAPGEKARPRVLMIGHFDTVYAAGTAAARPFRLEGDRAFGPGALDMKGGLTVGIFALEALRAALGTIPCDVTFILNGDEEIGSPRSRHAIFEEARRHDLALVLEPGRPGPAVTVGRKGVGLFSLTVTGREAHAGAEPENGVNAVVEAAHKIIAIDRLNDPAAGTIVTAGVVQGGTKPYVVPAMTRIEVDCRVGSAEEQARVERALAGIAARSVLPGALTALSGGFHRPPMEASDASLAYVRRLQAVAGSVGYPLGAATTGGASDGNLTAAAGLATIDGLGVHGARAHSPDEFIEIASLAAKCRVLACFLAELACGDAQPKGPAIAAAISAPRR
jgi:glutamate carboxypeptidase